MGRKIPGKKHRGVKDPLKQQTERNDKLKLVINAPPANPNVQEIPKTVLEMNRLRELVKSGKFQNRKGKKRKFMNTGKISSSRGKLPGMVLNDSRIPDLKQRPGESDEAFLWRVDMATEAALKEAEMEVKHDIVVKRDDVGQIKSVTPNEPMKHKNNKSKIAESSKLSGTKKKLERFKERKQLKTMLKKINFKEEDVEKKIDFVKFGEVVHQPPQFKRRPKGSDLSSFERPGRKKLLLSSLLEKNKDEKSMSDRKHIATAREEAMRVYKMMKAKNFNKNVS